jgi:hypothetical protein
MSKRKPARTIKARSASKIRSKAAGSGQPKDDVMAGVINEHEKVDRAGEAKWCDALRPMVEKYESGLFEPTRPQRD